MHRQALSSYSLLIGRQFIGSNRAPISRVGVVLHKPDKDSITIHRNCHINTSSCRIGSQTTVVKQITQSSVATNTVVNPDVKLEARKTDTKDSTSGSGSPYKTSAALIPTSLEARINQAKDQQTLLQLSTSASLNLKHACQILSYLGRLSKISKVETLQNLQKDDRFIRLCNFVQRGNHLQGPQNLLMAIQGLQNLGVSFDTDLMKTLETELKWSIRRCPIRFLARVVEVLSEMMNFHAPDNLNTPADNNKGDISLLHFAIQTFQRRWVEVSTGTEFISTFKIMHHLNDETRGKLEDRAVEMVQEFSAVEMVKMFVVLGVQKRRPTPLLRSLAFHLSKSETKMSTKNMLELIYALNELTFADPVLMQKLCTDIHTEIPAMDNPALVSSVVTSIGQMRYKHKEVIQVLDVWIMQHLDSLRPFDCASWLLTCAVLNIQSDSTERFCTKAKTLLTSSAVANPIEWLNIVHALAVLNQCSSDLLATVLNEKFTKQIDSLHERISNPRIKLLNLNAVAKSTLVKNYSGPSIAKDYITKWTSQLVGPSDPKLSKVVVDSLGNFLPPPNYLKLNKKMECGVYVDAICLLNEKMDPVPVESLKVQKNWIKVAVVVQGYPSMCLGMKEATGSSMLYYKLLENEGYRVILVPYTEFSSQEKLLHRVQYLERKIKGLDISKSETTDTSYR